MPPTFFLTRKSVTFVQMCKQISQDVCGLFFLCHSFIERCSHMFYYCNASPVLSVKALSTAQLTVRSVMSPACFCSFARSFSSLSPHVASNHLRIIDQELSSLLYESNTASTWSFFIWKDCQQKVIQRQKNKKKSTAFKVNTSRRNSTLSKVMVYNLNCL